MNNLGLRTIQLGNKDGTLHYLKWEQWDRKKQERLISLLTGKYITINDMI